MKRTIHKLPSENDKAPQTAPQGPEEKVKQKIKSSVSKYKNLSREAIDDRLKQLDREWDTGRMLELNMAALILVSGVLGFTINKNWLAIAGIASAFMFQHALQGWTPPLPLIRRIGVRTLEEIDKERSALKKIRSTRHS